MHQSVGSDGGKVDREPPLLKEPIPVLNPFRGAELIVISEVFGEGGQERVISRVTSERWTLFQKRGPLGHGLPAVLLDELEDEAPASAVRRLILEAVRQLSQSHSPIVTLDLGRHPNQRTDAYFFRGVGLPVWSLKPQVWTPGGSPALRGLQCLWMSQSRTMMLRNREVSTWRFATTAIRR
jgi:hypothetical protein